MTAKAVDDELDRVLGRMARKYRAIQEKVEKDRLPRDQVLAALQAIHDGKFAAVSEALAIGGATARAAVVRQRPSLLHNRYTPLVQQIKNVWRWDRKYGWGLPKGWDEQLDVPPPELIAELQRPEHALVSVDVVAFLEAKGGVLGEHRTFDAYWEVIRTQHPKADRWLELQATPGRLQLLPGTAHVPGVRVEVIDHGANWEKTVGIKPMDVRSPETSPHAGLLASAANHPKRIRLMDGTTVPFEWIAGYQASAPRNDPWRHVPIWCWLRDGRRVRLSASWGDDRGPLYSVPVRREWKR